MNHQKYKTEKLVPINLPEICAPRARLMDIYRKASEKRCIYVHAPAGCGKTVSTLLWLRESEYKTIWIGLDAYDNTLAGFYRIFCMALFSAVPQEENLAELIKVPEFSASPVEYAIEILSLLSFEDCTYALVFDDFHLITNKEIIKSLIYVFKRLPLSVTIMVLSRNELPETFSQYEESGKIACIGADEQAFKGDEIRRHFASYGRFLTEREAEEVYALTEGWAIAVNALAMSGDFYPGEKSPSNPLRKYIKAQIWDKLDRDLRLFMLQTAVVDRFSEELCRKITDNPESQQILLYLLGENMFLSRRETEYRYHNLFLDFLREELLEELQINRQALYEKAANYYYDSGDFFNALCFYIKCNCSKGIADALYHFMKFNVQSSSEMSKVYFINKLPAEILEQNPCLYVSCAWCALLFGDAAELHFYSDKLYDRIYDIVRENKALLEISLFVYSADQRYTFTEQLAKLQAAAVPLDADPANIPKIISHNMPYFHRTYRDYSHYALNTEEHFAEFSLVFSSLLGSEYAVIESGIRAGLLYDQNRIQDALSLVVENPASVSPELEFLSRMQIAFCLYAMGKAEKTAQCRKEIEAFLKTKKLLYLLPVFSAYETKLKLLDGDSSAAKGWLENYFITESYNPEMHKIFLHFTTVRAYIVLGEYEKAELLCEKLWKLCTDYHRLLDAAEAAVLLTVILRLTDREAKASALLRKTLLDMEPYGYIRVFADEGNAILPVLKKLIKKADTENGTVMPGSAYMKAVYMSVYEQSKRYKGIITNMGRKQVKLSAQQKHMIELLAKGYKNAEVVELTGLSINTVRYHTKLAYQKLDVSNAKDAVLRAKELSLI